MSQLTDWLLESAIPSIRYLTLRYLLDRPADDPQTETARAEIMRSGPVPAILAEQTEWGSWSGERSFYTPKYTSTHWSILLLTELAADPQDERLRRGVEFMLAATESRALDYRAAHLQDWACFWGNLLRYVAYCGYADDPRVAQIVDVVALAAGDRDWGCRHNSELACAWGAARALWGLAALSERGPQVEAIIRSGLDFLFKAAHTLIRGDYPTDGAIHAHWSRLNAMLFYQADILFMLRMAADLNALDHSQAQAALDWLEARRQPNGRWRGAGPYRALTWRNLGASAEWVSLHAAMVLKRAGRA